MMSLQKESGTVKLHLDLSPSCQVKTIDGKPLDFIPEVKIPSLQKEKCKECDGNGYTAEHDSPDRHGEYGECLNCPVQVPCEKCEGTGLMSLQKESEKKNDHPGFCKDSDCHSKECMWFQGRESWKEELYESKPFLVPNGGDIKEVIISYQDWVWLESFISQALSNREKEIAEEVEKMKDDLDYDGAVWKESVIALILKH